MGNPHARRKSDLEIEHHMVRSIDGVDGIHPEDLARWRGNIRKGREAREKTAMQQQTGVKPTMAKAKKLPRVPMSGATSNQAPAPMKYAKADLLFTLGLAALLKEAEAGADFGQSVEDLFKASGFYDFPTAAREAVNAARSGANAVVPMKEKLKTLKNVRGMMGEHSFGAAMKDWAEQIANRRLR